MSRRGRSLALAAAFIVAGLPAVLAAAEVNLYSYRQEQLMKPLLDAFTAETGIQVKTVSGGDDAILERLRSEGVNSPADVLLTVDAGRLIRATEQDLFQPVKSAVLEQQIPSQYRDTEGKWFGLSVRARPIMYAKDRVKPEQLSTYEALAEPAWKGKICVRTSTHIYNQSLLASIIAANGEEKAEAWAKGVADNLARKPQGGDRDQLKAVAAGECDVALSNTYYLAGMLQSKNEEDRGVAQKIGVFWPNQQGRGAHVNVSGAGVAKHAKNKESAQKLIEFLVSDKAQTIYAEVVGEYPVKPGIEPSAVLVGFGNFKADTLKLAELQRHNAAALRITDRVGWR
jgi:iron(III) transport system substrate-binding protein